MRAAALLLVSMLTGCASTDRPGPPRAPSDVLGIALRADGWLRGDLHVHTDYEGGFGG